MFNTAGLCLGCMSDNSGEQICPICGYDNSTKNPQSSLPVKSILQNRYLVGAVLEMDGEGITYIGWDNAKSSKIKIKEYFPKGIAERNPDKTISVPTDKKYDFNEGLLGFMEINRAITVSTLPSLVKVFDVFEENSTAYAILEFVSGITLEEFLNKNGGSLKWEQVRPLFLPLIDTIHGMNEIGFIHGGISAETVIVGRDGKLRISKYSIRKLRTAESSITPTIYSGYAACEQYGIENLTIGKYTDVYGLCATIFRALIGSVPPSAVQRLENDAMTIPAKFAENLPHPVLAALANGLQVLPKNRTPNIENLKNELVYGEIQTPASKEKPANVNNPKSPQKNAKGASKKSSKTKSAKYALISSLCTILAILLIGVILVFTVFKDSVFGNKNNSSVYSTPSFNAPVVDSIGDVDSDVPDNVKLYPVPNLKGKYFSEIIDNDEYEMFEFVLTDKAYSDECPKGTVCAQSVEAGKESPRDTKIAVTISLGSKEFSIANLKGMDEETAKFELLKQGFLYENIKVLEKYDEDSEPGTVIEQSPKYGEKVNSEVVVEIYINSYKGEEPEVPDEPENTENTSDTE